MFEHLDDPAPAHPAPLDGVVERGRTLRRQRRFVVGAVAMFVLVGAIASAAALQNDGHDKVIVSNGSTTIEATVPPTDTTVPETTTTDATTTSIAALAPSSASTTSTQPPHDPHDLSMVSVTYPDAYGASTCAYPSGATFDCSHLIAIDAGQSEPVTYTVTNNGNWTVDLGNCTTQTVDLWSDILRAGQGPSSEGIWPQPYPSQGTDAAPEPCADIGHVLTPGQSETLYATILAGYRNAAGDVMPAPPGLGSFVPGFLPPCAQPCDSYPPNSLAVSIWPPNQSEAVAYTFHVKTMNLQAASGASVPVELTYTNPLAFRVRMPVLGPCWTVKSGSAQVDCSGKWPTVVVGPHATVDLVGTIWARHGFTATGAPLAPGKYNANLGDLHGSEYGTIDNGFPVLTVTA
jgi:hypothetical protein